MSAWDAIEEAEKVWRDVLKAQVKKNIFGEGKMGITLTPLDYGDQHKLQAQALFLYDLLKERDPAANISHRELPPFFKHLEFINSRPYAVWNVIELDGKPIGSVYITANDEIGLFLCNGLQGLGHGKTALKLFMEQNPRKAYYANVSPRNDLSRSFFSALGFKHIQNTFRLECA